MGKKKNRGQTVLEQNMWKIHGRRIPLRDMETFLHKKRSHRCLYAPGLKYLNVNKLDHNAIRNTLSFKCKTIEHQIIALREITQLTMEDYEHRYLFTQLLLTCLHRHHNVIYQGILFGSTVNGLGFRDSDVDLRLRPLSIVGKKRKCFEPVSLDDEMVDRTLRDVALQTTRCSPALGEFVPSSRCPVAKLTFLKGEVAKNPLGDVKSLQEGLRYDVTLSSMNSLGIFNSEVLRFLCRIEPKFHLLASTVRYWSNVHQLILPGRLSSYALVNMLIYFCQTIEPPLLPTIDQMRELYLKHCTNDGSAEKASGNGSTCKKALTQLEWSCIICLKEEFYTRSTNTEPLSVLLLKFFELYLNFPYSTHIITTRPGRALDHEEFKISNQYHPRFPINQYLTIQDPFDLKHNLTAGMRGEHFKLLMLTIRYSYEKLFKELLNNFSTPSFAVNVIKEPIETNTKAKGPKDRRLWGLNSLFVKPIDPELRGFHLT